MRTHSADRLRLVPMAVGALVLVAIAILILSTRSNGPESGRIPEVGASFQYQLSDLPVDRSVEADVFDVDLFEVPDSTVDALHDQGHTVICYFSAGSFEEVRPDADRFPVEALGTPLEDFPDERWLDPRRLDELVPIMEDRLDQCVEKGFDGVEFDNVDAFANESGFELTPADQISYLDSLSVAARERGLSPGLKNALTLGPDIVDLFDWVLIEQCFQFDECDQSAPFIDAHKAVFVVEYEVEPAEICDEVPDGLSVIFKEIDLGPSRRTCS